MVTFVEGDIFKSPAQVLTNTVNCVRVMGKPALGCGLGGLKWSEVQPLIVKHLGALPDLDVYVYEPQNVASSRSDTEGLDSEKISARPREL